MIWTHPDNMNDITPECDPKLHGTAVYNIDLGTITTFYCIYCGKLAAPRQRSDLTQYELTKARQNDTGSTA